MIIPRKITMTLVVVGSLSSGKTDLFKKLFSRRPASVSSILVGTIKYKDPADPNIQAITYKALVLPANDSFKGTRARHYISADAIAIVFNKNKYKTFEQVPMWIEEILNVRRKVSIALVEYTPKSKITSPYPTSKIVTALDTQELLQKIKKKYHLTIPLFEVNGTSEDSINEFMKSITVFVMEAHTKHLPAEIVAEKEVRKEAKII